MSVCRVCVVCVCSIPVCLPITFIFCQLTARLISCPSPLLLLLLLLSSRCAKIRGRLHRQSVRPPSLHLLSHYFVTNQLTAQSWSAQPLKSRTSPQTTGRRGSVSLGADHRGPFGLPFLFSCVACYCVFPSHPIPSISSCKARLPRSGRSSTKYWAWMYRIRKVEQIIIIMRMRKK